MTAARTLSKSQRLVAYYKMILTLWPRFSLSHRLVLRHVSQVKRYDVLCVNPVLTLTVVPSSVTLLHDSRSAQ